MRKNFVAIAACAVVLVAGCSSTNEVYTYSGRVTLGNAALLASVPPLNNILFGPCKDEFGMPDSRRGNCELYYRVRGEHAPWVERTQAADAAAYQPSELRCWRTLGKVAECEPVSGQVRTPPRLAAPNNMGAD